MNIKVVKMDRFMVNKRCPDCNSDAFVIKKIGGQDYMTWYCAKCERTLLKEIISKKEKKWNEGFLKIINLLRSENGKEKFNEKKE